MNRNKARTTLASWAILALGALVTLGAPGLAAAQEQGAGEAISQEARSRIGQALDAYEAIRARLASDEIAAVTAAATTLERAARQASTQAPEDLRRHIRAIQAAARRLREISKEDPGPVRQAFGRLSQHVVALVVAEPTLRRGWHIFECPMANGYKKWLQKSDQISNPYMGQRMPRCGSRSRWE